MSSSPLSPHQIAAYMRDGVLVVDGLLTRDEVVEARRGLATTLMEGYGVDVRDLKGTGRGLSRASSTDGAGGVLDIFYPEWKMKIATNEALFRMTCQLWKEAYCHSGETLEDLRGDVDTDAAVDSGGGDGDVLNGIREVDESFKWHPYGAFDCDKGYMYIDRIGFRIPTQLAESIGKDLARNKDVTIKSAPPKADKATLPERKRTSKPRAIQRSLTPHFDCCPENYHDASSKNKWRPIQCFVSLTDNLQPNTGGFEAAPGFHREFWSWAENGRRLDINATVAGGVNDEKALRRSQDQTCHPRPCVGEYTHLSPSHDRELLRRVQHIPVKAGSAVFWDNRIPHANSYRNDLIDGNNGCIDDTTTSGSRAVVYCSFLPDVEVNRRFIRMQLKDCLAQRAPRVGDRWINNNDGDDTSNVGNSENGDLGSAGELGRGLQLSDLGRRLIGLNGWKTQVRKHNTPEGVFSG